MKNLQNRLYAAYGMNTNVGQMAYRCPNARSLGKLEIPNFRLTFRGVADIEESPGDTLRTVLWTITPMCEDALDRLEGYPYLYDKIYLDVDIDGVTYEVMLYQMSSAIRGLSSPSACYEELLVEGYREHGLDLEQIYNAEGYNMAEDNLDYLGRNHYNNYTY